MVKEPSRSGMTTRLAHQLSDMTVGVPAKIGPGHIQNACHKSCHLSQFARTMCNFWAPNT